MPLSGPDLDHHTRDRRFVHRMHRMRMLGVALTALPIAAAFTQTETPVGLWIALAANVLLWPQIAWLIGLRARYPVRAELWSLTLDAAAGGLWVAMLQLSALPGVLILSILMSDRYAAGGWPLVRRAAAFFVTAMVATLLATGTAIDFHTSERVMLASLPLLAIYPFALSVLSRRLALRVAHQNRQLASFQPSAARVELLTPQRLAAQASAFVRTPALDNQRAALLMVCLDQARTISDGYGAPTGDAVLGLLAATVTELASSTGVPAHWHDGAFALLLPHTDEERATAIGELVRMRVRQIALEEHPQFQCTASIGVALWPGRWDGSSDWLKGAEGAMHHARRLGGDRVFVAKPPPVPALSQ